MKWAGVEATGDIPVRRSAHSTGELVLSSLHPPTPTYSTTPHLRGHPPRLADRWHHVIDEISMDVVGVA